jgi:hypothetical protein
MDTTVVTANYYFNDTTRSQSECLENMKTLLSIPCYLIIFCDDQLYNDIKKYRDVKGLDEKTFYFVNKFEDIWSYKYYDKVKQNREKYWPTRDPRAGIESHLITNNKFDFVLKAMDKNPFQTSKFAWIDSNLGQNGKKISTSFTHEKFINLLNKTGPKFHIQVMGVVDKKYMNDSNLREYYSRYQWVVCGCLFTLENNEKNIIILNRLKSIFVETTELGFGHGEEMNYLKVLDEFYDDIDKGYGDYQNILENFLEPKDNLGYVINNIIYRYFIFGYFRECYDACTKVLETYPNISFDLYILFFETSLKCKTKTESRKILFKLISIIENNTIFYQAYQSKEDVCNNLFKLAF